MTSPSRDGRRQVVGVSIPRAGHHYLIKLLSLALGADFFHCEYYTPLGCCRTIPCRQGDGRRVVFQKNHDFDLSVPPDLPGVTYVVQHRAPLLATLSDREYLARLEGAHRADDRDEFVVWLGEKAAYLRRFWEKWMRPPRSGRVPIDYAVLLQRPVDVVVELLWALEIEPDRAAIEGAVSRGSGQVADFPAAIGETPQFVPRQLASSRYFDEELLPIFESLVLSALPELEDTRCFPAVATDGHPIALVCEARLSRAAGDPARAAACLEAAVRAQPLNAHLWHALADAQLAAGQIDGAVAAEGEAVRLRPAQPAFVRGLSDAHRVRADGELSAAIEQARTLARLCPADPGHLIHLASLLSRCNAHEEAVNLAVTVTRLNAADPAVWREASEIFCRIESWDSATAATQGAILRDGANPEFHAHLGHVLVHDGRIDEAIAAFGRAIELKPQAHMWRCRLIDMLAKAGRFDEGMRLADEGLRLTPGDAQLTALRARLVRLREAPPSPASSHASPLPDDPADPLLPPTRADVRMAYRLILGREPENDDVIRHHAAAHPDRRSLVTAFLSSGEFARSTMREAAAVPLDLEQRAAALTKRFAPSAPVDLPGPDHWIDALGVRTRCAYRAEWRDWGGTVVPGHEHVPLEWVALLEALAAAGDELCLVELGAGYGRWLVRGAVAWRRHHPDRPFVLVGVEGEPTHLSFLRQHAADNGIPVESLRLFAGAIGARDGHVEFEVARRPAGEWGTRAAVDAPPGLPRVAHASRITVPSFTLETVTANLRRVDLLHMDVQGSEEEIVAVSGAVLAATVSRLFVGTHSRRIEASLMETLPPLGFDLLAETPCGYDLSGPAPVLVRDGGQYWINRR